MNLLEGKLLAEGQRIGVVAARFNEFITAKLVGGSGLGTGSIRDSFSS